MRSAAIDLRNQPLRNLAVQPCPVSQSASGGWTSAQNDVTIIPNGRGIHPVARYTRTSGQAVSNRLSTRGSPMDSTRMGYLFWARANVPISVTVRATGGSGTTGIAPSLPAEIGTEWTQIRNEFDVTVAPGAFGDWAPNIVHSAGASGDWMEVTELVTWSGHYEGEYFDGDTPGATWEGNARTSRSRRYPYTLEDAAGGTPLAIALGAVASVGVPPLPATLGRTLYTVYDSIDLTSSNGSSFALYRAGATQSEGLLAVQTSNGGSPLGSAIRLATTLKNGPTLAQARTGYVPGRNLCTISVTDDITSVATQGTGGTVVNTAVSSANDGFAETPGLLLHVANPSRIAVASYLFAAAHSLETRVRVFQWLANRYGIALPA